MKKIFIMGFIFLSSLIPVIKPEDSIKGKLPSLVELKSVKSAVLMEVETNQVLYQFNAHEKRAPASMTKIMTMKLVLDAIKNNQFTLNDILTTSEYASSMGGSQIFLSPFEQMKAEDLFKSMVIASANDAAVVLAEKVSGTENNFVNRMNHIAKSIGCYNTNFINCTGLPTANHYTTCYDMGLIACNLLKNYEDIVIKYSSMYESYVRTDTPNPFWLVNTNKMLKLNNGIDGLKTGWTTDAGYCITTTMKKDGMRLVCVVMGADDPKLRNSDAMAILNYGFNTYDLLVLKDKGEIVDRTNDILMDLDSYNIVLRNKLCVIKEKNSNYDDITYEIKLYKDKLRNLEYENIGIIKAYKDGKIICESSLDLESIPKKSNFFEVLYKIFKSLF